MTVPSPGDGGPCPCAYGPPCLHDGHCCFLLWNPDNPATNCHEAELLALIAEGVLGP